MSTFFKKISSLIIILSITFFFILLFLEIYASLNHHKFPSYSWQTDNIMENKVNYCKKKSSKKKIGVFGDSAIEYHGENLSNIVQQLSKKFTNHSLCNFGLSGSEMTLYINRFLYSLEKGMNFDKVIFYLFEGNDFSSFRYHRNNEDYMTTKIGGVTGIFNYNSQETVDRRLSLLRTFVKSTYAVNIIYREIVKKYFIPNKINENFVKKIYNKNKYYEVPIENAMRRMNATPKEVKKKLSSDLINKNIYKLALRNPNYYEENHRPGPEDFLIQKEIAFHHIDFINSLCKKNLIDCRFIIVPTPNFLFKETKEIWKNIFRFNYYKEFGPSSIVKLITTNYPNVYYPEGVLEYDDYIEIDMHLTGQGNAKMANFTYEKFIK